MADYQSLQSLPKVELHRHLEGSFTRAILKDAIRKFEYISPVKKYDLSDRRVAESYQFLSPGKTLKEVLDVFANIRTLFKNLEVIQYLTSRVIENSLADNIKLLELRLSPSALFGVGGICPEKGLETIIETIDDVISGTDTKVGLLLLVNRQFPDSFKSTLKLANQYRKHVWGMDLAGDEAKYPPELYQEMFQLIKENDIPVTIHAGEDGGPENIVVSVNQLHARRIGHGVAAGRDLEVRNLLKCKKIGIEICPTSNLLTGAVESLKQHPLIDFIREKIPISINTDDPGLFEISLTGEYLRISELFNISIEQFKTINADALKSSFAPEEVKSSLNKVFNLTG